MANCTESKPKWPCSSTLELTKEMYNYIYLVPSKADKINTYTKSEIDTIISELPSVVVPTKLSEFTDDLGSNPIHTHSQYLTEHQDLSDYIQKNYTAGLVKNDGTIDTNTYLTQHQDISGKVDKVNTADANNFASFNNEGGIKDSGVNSNSFASSQHSHTVSDISDFPTIPAAQIQSDWNQTNNTAVDYIKNKPIEPFIIYATSSDIGTTPTDFYKDLNGTTLLLSDIQTAVYSNRELVLKWYNDASSPLLLANSRNYTIDYDGNNDVQKLTFGVVDGDTAIKIQVF